MISVSAGIRADRNISQQQFAAAPVCVLVIAVNIRKSSNSELAELPREGVLFIENSKRKNRDCIAASCAQEAAMQLTLLKKHHFYKQDAPYGAEY